MESSEQSSGALEEAPRVTGLGPRDFLRRRSDTSLRREIQNLVDSYSHPWDVLAELLQNSIDAVRKHRSTYGLAGRDSHQVDITIDRRDRSLRVRDTGIGFDAERFLDLLAPHGTDKASDASQIGEKGVGLTYTVFVSDRYAIRTQSVNTLIAGAIADASRWRHGSAEEIPQFVTTEWTSGRVEPSATFTEIHLSGVDREPDDPLDLFEMPLSVLVYVLRTKTAIGNLRPDPQLDTSVRLVLLDESGLRSEVAVAFAYMWPEEFLAGNTVDLDDFKSRAGPMDDRQKARELGGKALTQVGSVTRSNREIRYHVLFSPSRTMWREISEKNGITSTDEQGDTDYLYAGGIFVGTKGMPTGVELEPPATGQAGYWPNFFMLLEDDSITFDVGRKSVPGRTKGMLKEIAAGIFDEFRPYMSLVSRSPTVTQGENPTVLFQERAETFGDLDSISDLDVPAIGYLKHPDGQEAAVMALFHELVGAGILRGYFTLRTGLKETYDLWGRYRIAAPEVGQSQRHIGRDTGIIDLPVVIEFKYQAHSILSDFEQNVKQFSQIDLIVCWDVDETKFRRYDVKVEELPPDEVLFYGSNYRLVWPGAYNLGQASTKTVLGLRRFLQDYRRTTSPAAGRGR